VLGICAFREAGAFDDVARDRRYMTAVSFLREADRQSMIEDRRPEWNFAMGISLFRTGLADVALPGLRHPRTGEPLDRAAPHQGVRRLALERSS